MKNIRHAIVGVAVAGALTLGLAGPAFATSAPVHTPPSAECVKAYRTLVDLRVFDSGLHVYGRNLGIVRTWAVNHNHPQIVAAIDARLAQVAKAETAIEARIVTQRAAAMAACAPPAARVIGGSAPPV